MFSVSDLLNLSQVPGIGAGRVRALVSHFGDPGRVFAASAREIAEVEGFSKKLAHSLAQFAKSPKYGEAKNYSERQLSSLNRAGGRIVTLWDREYPGMLRQIYDPPAYLFLRGNIADEDKYAVSIVGSRHPSEYGIMMAEKFSSGFAELGITVVSGLARGIDTAAHSSALKNNGRTLAVIGSGIDVIYPPENKGLSERITAHGAVISEYEMGAKPDAVNFPKRNRIISGLTLGTLVVETDINGGAMITANTALDQNREIFAIPGAVTSRRSKGCHALIKEGRAKLVECTEDVIQELHSSLGHLSKNNGSAGKRRIPDMNIFEKSIYDILTSDPRHIDLISESAGMPTSDVLVNLLNLEFKGLVRQFPGKMFVKL